MAISKEDVLEYISGLSVLELSELVKDFEEKFGVSAAPVMVAGAGAGAAVPVVVEPDVVEGLPPLSPPPPPPPQAVSNAARATGPSWRVTECQEEFMNAPPYFLFGFCE